MLIFINNSTPDAQKAYILQSHHMTEQYITNDKTQSVIGYSICIYTALTIFVVYTAYKLKQARKRKRKIHNSIRIIEKDKIILAIEIKDFVIKYAEKPAYGYLPLDIVTQTTKMEWLRRKILNLGHYYKPMFPLQKIKEFIHGLQSIEKVQLVLYTSLDSQIAQVILSKLGIDKYFPPNMRRFCDLQNRDDQKHAIQVDQDTRRVIIITSTYDDHYHQNEKYFLVLRPKVDEPNFLKNWVKQLKSFIQNNENLNYLHDELGQFKINFDSELSDFEA